ncbi:MAG: tRNA threonylcarbamoyladenosine biosynthesis protein TsaB, partial [Desulfocucumaceae bacterium]
VWRVPIVGVGTLDVLAYPLKGMVNLVCPILNARKNEVYAAVYDGADGYLKDLTGRLAIKPDDLALRLLEWPGRSITFLGDGVPEYREKLIGLLGDRAVFAPGMMSLPRGSSVAELGWNKLAGGEGTDPLLLLPDYVRLSEAELKWQQKQQKLKTSFSG